MNTLIIFTHPNPNSYNKAILDIVIDGLETTDSNYKIRDLYSLAWDPVLTADDFKKLLAGEVSEEVAREQELVTWADNLIFIFPIWWTGPPAILKGWFDRVFSLNFAYKKTENGEIVGLLSPKKAIVITTSGEDKQSMEQNCQMDVLELIFRENIFAFCGFQETYHKNLYGVERASQSERQDMLQNVQHFIVSCFLK